jgi:hypothetical protein
MIKPSFELSKGDFLEPFLELIVRVIFKAGAKHSHESNQLDFWDILLIVIVLLIIGGFLYQAFKKIKKS